MDTMTRFAVGAIIGFLGTATAVAQVPADGRPLTLGVYWLAFHCNAATSKPLRWRSKGVDHCLDRTPIIDQRDVISAAFDNAASEKWTLETHVARSGGSAPEGDYHLQNRRDRSYCRERRVDF